MGTHGSILGFASPSPSPLPTASTQRGRVLLEIWGCVRSRGAPMRPHRARGGLLLPLHALTPATAIMAMLAGEPQ